VTGLGALSPVNFDGSTVWPDLGIVTRQLRRMATDGGRGGKFESIVAVSY
jgi:hypothetical protein